MSELSRTVKINYNDEIRKLKMVDSFQELVENIKNKLKIELEDFEIKYEDEDGDEITISNEEDYTEWFNACSSKVPKLFLKETHPKEVDSWDNIFSHISLAESTLEKPPKRKSESEEGGEFKDPVINSSEEEKEKDRTNLQVSVFDYEDIKVSSSDKGNDRMLQDESSMTDRNFTSDEKCASTMTYGVRINSSSVQTQSINNVEVSTDVNNLVGQSDQVIGTQELETEDKCNQKVVFIAESGNDPIFPDVVNQSINTNLIEEKSFENKWIQEQSIIDSQPEKSKLDEECIDQILKNVVRDQMKEITPILMDQWRKFLQAQQLELSQNSSGDKKISQDRCWEGWGGNNQVEIRYICRDWKSVSFFKNYLGKKPEIPQNENFVSCVNETVLTNGSHSYQSCKRHGSSKSHSFYSPRNASKHSSSSSLDGGNHNKRAARRFDEEFEDHPIRKRKASDVKKEKVRGRRCSFDSSLGSRRSWGSSSLSWGPRKVVKDLPPAQKEENIKNLVWNKSKGSSIRSSSRKSKGSNKSKSKETQGYKEIRNLSASRSDKDDSVEEQKQLGNENPVIADENIQDDQEYPEMVKRSVLMEYQHFDNDYIQKLQVKWVKPDNIIHMIPKDTDSFNIEFEWYNSDVTGDTRWPIYSTLVLLGDNRNQLEKCTSTTKETRAGVKAKFTARVKTPEYANLMKYEFQLVDEFWRFFGQPIQVYWKIGDTSIIDCNENTPIAPPVLDSDMQQAHQFQKPHNIDYKSCDLKYPTALLNLKTMGIEITDQVRKQVLEVKGNVQEYFEKFN